MDALSAIDSLNYTVIFARDLQALRRFYQEVLGFQIQRELGPQWIEFSVGGSVLALTERGLMFDDAPPPPGALSLQLAFRVAPDQVDACASSLLAKGVVLCGPVTDQPWGHRTLFFRDPDGNVLEIYAEI